MDWEDKISSIVKETETNLARVKDQLGSSRVRHSSQAKYYSSPNLDVRNSSFENSSFRSSNPLLSYSTNGFQSTSPQRMSGVNANRNEGSSSPALLNVLFERIEQQAETLSSLSHTVKRLEKAKTHQAETISTLQDQVSRLNERLREHGVDLQTERKLEGFKREMYSQLERIQSQNQLKQNRDDISYDDPSNATLARDLHENKRILQDDCNSLRREIDHLKTRIGKIELDTQTTMADAKDSNRRLERIDRTVNLLSENQRSQSRSIESIVDDRELRNSDMGSIRRELDELLTKVSQLESNEKGQSRDIHRRKQSGELLDNDYMME
ncbi:myosin heavy chain, cardiac muscle isoform-like [Actinia tenebrosa]|uniref:Myosin heavy chain, cardiac muscle isoform-like n=1 Tax=Actinia tenebrosa TaxID=6105 RepID=A0A6P8J434_ACTTE|nr:myosin heavy chain, cardiac muscle isoform-like [Actinia tenebrosa]